MKWVTRERPKIDRIACPWLIQKFIDQSARFLFVHKDQVRQVAETECAVPFDIPGVELTHDGELCSFDAFLRKYKLTDDPALARLAGIVRGADTDRQDLAPEASGLHAISLGLGLVFDDDHEMLKHGFVIYDSLFAWCQAVEAGAKEGEKIERHTWRPEQI